ncbi:hypothetical protein [Bergeyella sp. RCAD1439]|uniref:hypothetical protein n=1 Tax=Bergeyella anatis TaxID=3113737 RepID=UPI002E19E309|nr:hypothetical protein [Bergeyella sp. RCAD1439]
MKKLLVWTVGLLLGGTACQSRDKMQALEERLPKDVVHMKIKHDSLNLSRQKHEDEAEKGFGEQTLKP